MNDKNIYETNPDRKKELIDYFYNVLIELRPNLFLKVLKGYTNLQGHSVAEDMLCYFANEIPKDDEDYFGNTGIEYCFFPPAVEENCIVTLSDIEFYGVLQEKAQLYISHNIRFKKEILELLLKIKEKLCI